MRICQKIDQSTHQGREQHCQNLVEEERGESWQFLESTQGEYEYQTRIYQRLYKNKPVDIPGYTREKLWHPRSPFDEEDGWGGERRPLQLLKLTRTTVPPTPERHPLLCTHLDSSQLYQR